MAALLRRLPVTPRRPNGQKDRERRAVDPGQGELTVTEDAQARKASSKQRAFEKRRLKRQGEQRMAKVDCGECGKPAGLVQGALIYPHRPDLYEIPLWRCAACGAYVGCHPGGFAPLGSPALAPTRAARSAAHRAFDPMWQAKAMKLERDGLKRGEAWSRARGAGYAWLAGQLGIEPEECHIGMMSVAMCERVVEICDPFVAAMRRKQRYEASGEHVLAEAAARSGGGGDQPPWD